MHSPETCVVFGGDAAADAAAAEQEYDAGNKREDGHDLCTTHTRTALSFVYAL